MSLTQPRRSRPRGRPFPSLALVALLAAFVACRSTRPSFTPVVSGPTDHTEIQPEVSQHRDRLVAARRSPPDPAAAVASSAEHPADLGRLLRACRALLDAGRHDDALRLLDAGEPVHGRAPQWQATRAGCLADPEARAAAAESALRSWPELLPALEQLARVESGRGNHAAAAALLARCSELDPFDSDLAERQGREWALAGHRFRAAVCWWGCVARELGRDGGPAPRHWAALAALYQGDASWPDAAGWFRARAGEARWPEPLPADLGPALPPPPEFAGELGLALGGGDGRQATAVIRYCTAWNAGVEVGDVVQAIAGQPVPAGADFWQLAHWLATLARPGDQIAFQVRRGGVVMDLAAPVVQEAQVWDRLGQALTEAGVLERRGRFAEAATAYGDALVALPVNHAALAGLVRSHDRAGNAGAAIAVLEVYAKAFPQRLEFTVGLGQRLARAGEWSRLADLLAQVRGRFPTAAELAALDGLVADHSGRRAEASAAFERALDLGGDGDALALLALQLDRRVTQDRIAERRRREAEAQRLAAEQAAAERARHDALLRNVLLMHLLGGGASGGAGSAPGYQYTGPSHLQQWSNQQMMNGMWSHNMGR